MGEKKRVAENEIPIKQDTRAENIDLSQQIMRAHQIDQKFFQQQEFQQVSQQQYPTQNLLINSSTGIKELDKILDGGFPKGSVILLAGSSGAGKTIFSFQWLFEGIKNDENGVYITLTEPLFKSVKNLETMRFYDRNFIEQERLKIIDIKDIYGKKGFDQEKFLNFIEEQVKQTNAKRLCIDSVTAIAYNIDDKAEIRKFIFELGSILATLGCTTILTSEVTEPEKVSIYNVEEFISDVILRLDQIKERDELQRTMGIIKVRGRGYKAENLFFKITDQGIIVFPKLRAPLEYSSSTEKISTGNAMLDKLLLGGIFKGSSTLVVGATGTGKSLMSMQFIEEGLKKKEPCFYVGFEESREQIIRNAKSFGWYFEEYEKKGLLTLRCVYPRDKFIEEHLSEIKKIVESKKIKRCVVDSLSSIANSLSREAFVSFTKRLNGYLKTQNVTTIFTVGTDSFIGGTRLTENHLSTMVDNIILLRYFEMQGALNLVMNIVKVRGSTHSKGLREFKITNKGVVIGQSLSGYEGIMTGVTRKVSKTVEEKLELEFKRFIGPMGTSVFSDLRSKGLTKENIFNYIDGLTKEKIMKKDDANLFKQNVNVILSKSLNEEHTTRVFDRKQLVSTFPKENQKEEIKEEKKSLWKRVFGKVK